MTLSQVSAVAFAVAGGQPTDAREWISIDLAGFPDAGRRGYLVATEPIGRSGFSRELASHARVVILDELRRLRQSPPDVALGRAFAAANAAIYEQTRVAAVAGSDQRTLVGACAAIFEGHTATIAYVPPGQVILVEDGLVYAIPELESWFPHYRGPNDGTSSSRPEPLGFATFTAPLIAQTELAAGDTIIASTAVTGRVFAEEVSSSGFAIHDLTYLHRRDPDLVLDVFKGVVLARDMPDSAAAVIAFPPATADEEVRTFGDIGRRSRERWRHGKAALRQWQPVRSRQAVPANAEITALPAQATDTPSAPGGHAMGPAVSVAPAQRRSPKRIAWERPATIIQERAQRLMEGGGPKRRSTWERPSSVRQFGVPGAHGVNVFRGQSQVMGERSWRQGLPRLPFIGSAWIWPLLVMLIVGMVFGGLYVRDQLLVPDVDPDALIAAIDDRIVAAGNADSDAETVAQLDRAQELIDNAREAQLPDAQLDKRQLAVTEQLDDATDVIRMSDVQRVGSLPDQFNKESVQAVYTPVGIFFAAGSLYQWQVNDSSEAPSFIEVLKQGSTTAGVTVGKLYGVAFDAKGLYATDGTTVFMLDAAEQTWKAVKLERINDQPWQVSAVGAFDGAVYLLQPDGAQIYKFDIDGTDSSAPPEDWLVTGAREDMRSATDMAIDGKIYVSLDDGRVLPMYLGDLDGEIAPPYMTTTAKDGKTVRVISGTSTGYLYAVVSDGNESRIVAFDQEAGHARQLKLPIGFSTVDAKVSAPFAELKDVVIDESSGTVYIINGDGIWTARYSLPPLPSDPQGSPEAT